MKKRLLISFLIISLIAGAAIAAGLKPFAFPFIGKWNSAEDSMLIDDYGFSDIQNLRKDGKHLKGVSGHTSINTIYMSGASNTYPYALNGYHFKKDNPAESHVVVYAADSATPTDGRLYQNTTAIPSQGDFTTTALYTPTAFNNIWRFSAAPDGNMVASNGDETLIWGGAELEATAIVTSSTTVTYAATTPNDYSDILNNTFQTTDQTATLAVAGGNDAYTVLLLHGDGVDESTTFTDSSASAHSITTAGTAGDVKIDTAQKKFGTASINNAAVDGTGRLVSADSADWYIGNAGSNFTIDFWVRFNAAPDATTITFIGQTEDANNKWVVYRSNSNKLSFYAVDTSTAKADYATVNDWKPTINTWYHIAVVRNDTALDMYINGAAWSLTPTTAISTNDLGDHAGSLYICSTSTGANGLDGWMDEVRISRGAARWTANFFTSLPTQAYGNGSNVFLVGSKRPFQGVKFYISSGNTVASTMSGMEWQGTSWGTLTLTDNTDTGPTLATTGTITWTYTGNAKPRYINGISLYWCQFSFNAGQASIYYVTVDAPMQPIRNVGDGSMGVVARCLKYDGTTYKDYTDEISDEDTTTTYADLSSLNTTHALYLGFLEPQQGYEITFVAGSENSNATVLTNAYWNGAEWEPTTATNDGTQTSTTSLSKGGVISFQGTSAESEFKRAISDELPLYYYKLTFSAQFDADVKISEIRGIEFPKPILPHNFSETFQNRLFLFRENTALYSVYNAPDIYNGGDSDILYFGTDEPVTAVAKIYNVFQTTGYEQLLVMKANETYRLTGTGPSDWELTQMSGNVGCIAPLSVAVCEIADIGEGTKRHVAIWQSGHGVVMSDGATIQPISDDIKNYWDPNSSTYIPTTRQDDSVGWYDPNLKSYKLLISSGAGQTTHNVELEYSLKTNEWTKLYRENGSGANPLQVGFQVKDTTGNAYSYGATNEGYMYRLENGKTWDGTPIAQYVQTKEMILDEQKPLFRDSIIRHIRTTLKKKSTGAGEDIGIIHYCDGSTAPTVDEVNDQSTPADIDMIDGKIDTQDVYLGPCLAHSLKYQVETSTVYDGAELTGAGLYYEPLETIRVDR